jgi:predicted lipoprotein with Yx(FWY)xxD motif
MNRGGGVRRDKTFLSGLRFAPGLAAIVAILVLAGCGSATTPKSTVSTTITSTTSLSGADGAGSTATSSPPPAKPVYTINISVKTPAGKYLVDDRGMTLYYTASDRPNYSNLPDETLTSWPVFLVPAFVVPQPLNASDFGTYTRDNGLPQTTYKGYPLYYFFQDKAPGDTLGNNLGGVWSVVDPDKFPP